MKCFQCKDDSKNTENYRLCGKNIVQYGITIFGGRFCSLECANKYFDQSLIESRLAFDRAFDTYIVIGTPETTIHFGD